MKNLKFSVIIGIAFFFIFSACSIEKRVYMSGYHVEWKNSDPVSRKSEFIKTNNALKTQSKIAEVDVKEQSEILPGRIPESVVSIKISSVSAAFPNKTSRNEKTSIVENRKKALSYYGAILKKATGKIIVVKNNRHSSRSNGTRRGFAMIMMGLILIGVGYLFFQALSVGASTLFLIFGIAGTICIVIGILRIIFW